MSFRYVSSISLAVFLAFSAAPTFAQDDNNGLGSPMPRPAASQAFKVIQLELSGGKLPFRQVVILNGTRAVTIVRFQGTPEKKIATFIGLATPQEMSAVEAALAKSPQLPATVADKSTPPGDSAARLWVSRGTTPTTETTGSVTALAANPATQPLADAVSEIAKRVQAAQPAQITPAQITPPQTTPAQVTHLKTAPVPVQKTAFEGAEVVTPRIGIVKRLGNLDGSTPPARIAGPPMIQQQVVSPRTLPATTAATATQSVVQQEVASKPATYTIKRGDTLWDLAHARGMTWEDLYNFEGNSKRLKSGDPHWIYPGETLLFPPAKSAPAQPTVVQQTGTHESLPIKAAPARLTTPLKQNDGASAEPGSGTRPLPPAQKKPVLQGPLG